MKPIPFETAKLRCIDRLLREEGVIGLLWVAFPFADQPFAIGVNGLLLVVDRDAPPAGATEHWKWSDARIEVLRKRVDDWEQTIKASGLAPIYMIEADFLVSQARHDIDWLERFIRRIADPTYVWPTGTGKRRKG